MLAQKRRRSAVEAAFVAVSLSDCSEVKAKAILKMNFNSIITSYAKCEKWLYG